MGEPKGLDTQDTPDSLVIYVKNEVDREQAERLAKRLNVKLIQEQAKADKAELSLRFDEDGLSLVSGKLSLRGDLTNMLPRIKPGRLPHELLVKAAKLKGMDRTPLAIDATAGLGEDSILLAAAGFSVQLYEYDPVIAALLRDALLRASKVPELESIVGRMQLFEEDSLAALPNLPVRPDLIFLDPMFPTRQKSALIKKKFQLLQRLEQPCSDEEALVHAALSAQPRKVVIKRPAKGPFLAGLKPDYSLTGKAIRYDCFVMQPQQPHSSQTAL
jgi:16S rRNA (guanine1516-N2)-methyltransferase